MLIRIGTFIIYLLWTLLIVALFRDYYSIVMNATEDKLIFWAYITMLNISLYLTGKSCLEIVKSNDKQ